jgi:hypothetical protein
MRRRARAAEKPMKLTVANGARSLSASRWKVGNTRSGADMHRPGPRGLLSVASRNWKTARRVEWNNWQRRFLGG